MIKTEAGQNLCLIHYISHVVRNHKIVQCLEVYRFAIGFFSRHISNEPKSIKSYFISNVLVSPLLIIYVSYWAEVNFELLTNKKKVFVAKKLLVGECSSSLF